MQKKGQPPQDLAIQDELGWPKDNIKVSRAMRPMERNIDECTEYCVRECAPRWIVLNVTITIPVTTSETRTTTRHVFTPFDARGASAVMWVCAHERTMPQLPHWGRG